MNATPRAATMPRERSQVTLGALLLFVAVCATYCRVLAIIVEHRREIATIWESFMKGIYFR